MVLLRGFDGYLTHRYKDLASLLSGVPCRSDRLDAAKPAIGHAAVEALVQLVW